MPDSSLHQGLPLHHPDYRFPTSRNPYAHRLRELAPLAYANNEAESFLGHWREKFTPPVASAPLHVEIGTNAGHVLLEWAARDPSARFIGLDWKYKQIHRAADKARRRGLSNVIFLR